jgi:hypothetical protein
MKALAEYALFHQPLKRWWAQVLRFDAEQNPQNHAQPLVVPAVTEQKT